MIGVDYHQTGQLAVGTGKRIEGEFLHAADFAESSLQRPVDFERALDRRGRLGRMKARDDRVGGEGVAEFGVIFHRTRPQGIEACVDAEVVGGLVGVVAGDRRFVHLGQSGSLATHKCGREMQHGIGPGAAGQVGSAPSTARMFEYEFGIKAAVHGSEVFDG